MSAAKHRFRWTGELVDVLEVHEGDLDGSTVATVRREDGTVTTVPYAILRPVTSPRFRRPPAGAGTGWRRIPSF